MGLRDIIYHVFYLIENMFLNIFNNYMKNIEFLNSKNENRIHNVRYNSNI